MTISASKQDPKRSHDLSSPEGAQMGMAVHTHTEPSTPDTYHNVDGLLAGCANGYPAIGSSAPADALLLWMGMTSRCFAVRGVEAARRISQTGFGAAGRL